MGANVSHQDKEINQRLTLEMVQDQRWYNSIGYLNLLVQTQMPQNAVTQGCCPQVGSCNGRKGSADAAAQWWTAGLLCCSQAEPEWNPLRKANKATRLVTIKETVFWMKFLENCFHSFIHQIFTEHLLCAKNFSTGSINSSPQINMSKII